jgi:membrane-bound lytic murein transglycosylase C
MKKYLLMLTAVLMAFVPVRAQENEDAFEKFKQQANTDFDTFSESVNRQWDDYEQASKEAFENFKKGIELKWGATNFKESTPKDWVEYSNDQMTRTLVDFETGEATIELLLSPEEAANADLVRRKMSEAVKDLSSTRGTSKDFSMDFEEPMPLSDQPVLKDQLVTEDGKPVTGSNLNAFADEVVDKKPIEKKPVTGADEQKRVVVSVKLPLAPNSIQTRAEKFYEPIRTFAARYDLDPELVFAIMHTESYFNPKARSHVPAFGLMQIVPRYAGRDAYKFVHGEDRLLNENYLYEAEKNIELGAAYLHILLVRNFGRVNDPLSRLYCSIAAYNTGAGNVSRAFIGSTKLGEAIPKINQMKSSQVYEHLRVYLPYQETRDYIEKVTKRMNSYRDWMSN